MNVPKAQIKQVMRVARLDRDAVARFHRSQGNLIMLHRRMARQKGIPVVTGVEMFVQQGARQFEIWTGKRAPEEEMLRVVVHALRQRAEATAADL